jgi:hypothetical protein
VIIFRFSVSRSAFRDFGREQKRRASSHQGRP